jgi:hypothetical protein
MARNDYRYVDTQARCEACDHLCNHNESLCYACRQEQNRADEAFRIERCYRVGWNLPDREQSGVNG